MALFNYRECISDCNEVLNFVENLPENEKDNFQKTQIRAKSRKAIALSWEGSSFELADQIFVDILEKSKSLGEDIHREVEGAYKRFQTRYQAISLKVI